MKIGILTTLGGPGSTAGGVWTVAETQARALAAQGHEVRLIAGWLGLIPQNGGVCGYGPEYFRLRKLLPGSDIRFLVTPRPARIAQELASWADLLHVHYCRDQVTTCGLRSLQRKSGPVFAQCHGMMTSPSSLAARAHDFLLGGRAFERVDYFLTLSEFESRQLSAMGAEAHQILPIHNAAKEPSVRWTNSPKREAHFVFASRLHRRKQPMVFVEAGLKLLHSGRKARFTIAGEDQGEEKEILRRIKDSAYGDSFSVVGSLSLASVMELLSTSTAMVLPSRNEPYPMIAIEAAAAAVPIIVSNDTGISQILADSDGAMVVAPSTDAIASAMRQIYDSAEDLTLKLSAGARSAFDEFWTEKSLAIKLEEYYGDALAGRQPIPRLDYARE